MTIIGVTGSFGTGKTTVAKLFKKLGAQVIDADQITHALLKQGTEIYKKVVKVFGKEILFANGEINRKELGKVVFNNAKLLNKLTAIIHPEVIRQIKLKIKNSARSKLIVIDAPLLLEAGLSGLLDFLVVVKAKQNTQIKRIQKEFGLKRADILKRIKRQLPLKEKLRWADFIVDNEASLDKTRKQVQKIYQLIKGEHR